MLFYFVTITTHISNIKGKKEEEICSNKDVIYFTVKNKKRSNWIKPHHNYMESNHTIYQI
jgi:hypothetical protein